LGQVFGFFEAMDRVIMVPKVLWVKNDLKNEFSGKKNFNP